MGNIAERLLREGFARCVDWSIAMVSKDKERLRAAEKTAKQQQIRIWKGYKPAAIATLPQGSLVFFGKVIEVVNGDSLLIKRGEQQLQKIWFSSLRPPRTTNQAPKEEENVGTARRPQQRTRPLYDIPYMWEARECLRKKLIGKKVNVRIDYIKPAQDSFPEKVCCTLTRDDINIAEALISKGLACCLRHKQDDDQRSPQYDELMAAEARAVKNGKGVHSKKDHIPHRVSEISNDPGKAKQFLPFLQRAGRTVALVEFIASGSRLRLYLPKDTCLITFLLAGISCPRAPRDDAAHSDQFGQQALMYTKELIMQREVEIEVDACDKGGNFIGWLYYEGRNLSVSLLEEGLSKIGPLADRTAHFNALLSAEKKAKELKKNLWKDYMAPTQEESEGTLDEVSEGENTQSSDKTTDLQEVVVTEIMTPCHFWIQLVDQGIYLLDSESLKYTRIRSPRNRVRIT
jgi:staphylococcal nuclease domain-containing protein 1